MISVHNHIGNMIRTLLRAARSVCDAATSRCSSCGKENTPLTNAYINLSPDSGRWRRGCNDCKGTVALAVGREVVFAFEIDREGCVRRPTRSWQEFHIWLNQDGPLLKKRDTLCTANYISHCPIPPGMRPLARRVHQDPDYSPEPWLFRLEGRRRRGMMEGMKEGRKKERTGRCV